MIELRNQYVNYIIGADGVSLHFIDRRSGEDYCRHDPDRALARIRMGEKTWEASAASYASGKLTVRFGDSGVSALVGVRTYINYFVLEVLSISNEDVDELTFIDLHLAPGDQSDKAFSGCTVALNVQTDVPELPGPSTRLQATCYRRFGVVGAAAALIGCPQDELRGVLKEVVSAAPELPHSAIGGPWALDAPTNWDSYIINYGGLSEDTVDHWIGLARDLGFTQIDFHGGNSFRFGDCKPNPETYPKGLASLRAVIEKLHQAGIQAGLHTYAFFIDKNSRWVTPVPDPRLGKDASFTLAAELTADATTVPVVEATTAMSTITGFFVSNSVTLQIDEELIVYSDIRKEPPYAFTRCQRGAYGTTAAAHKAGAKVHHLRECFGLFLPDLDSTLFTEVAAKTAEMFNTCGFDMIYLDALVSIDLSTQWGVIEAQESAWYYESKFTFELCKRLQRPALMEMSAFHHHLWFVRSRMGAWDHPTKSHKKFIDLHCAANRSNQRTFLPGNLGWWAFQTWAPVFYATPWARVEPPQTEPTFPDDIEYLCCKAIGTDAGLSITNYNPDLPAHRRLAEIVKQYEKLRHARYFPESVKARLRVPGDEFTLVTGPQGQWQFRPVQYAYHKVEGINGWSNNWQVHNPFGQQPLRLRIEALSAAGPYDAEGNVVLADYADPNEFPDRAANEGVALDLEPSTDRVKVGASSGRLTASSTRGERQATWAKAGKLFSPLLNLAEHPAMGVWVYGDGKGEVINFQLNSPEHIAQGIGEHYVIVDFEGWRYFELIEVDARRYGDYSWPYGAMYRIYREPINYGAVESLTLWINNLPANEPVCCYLSPIKAMPLVNTKLVNPAITVGGKTIVFPTEIESGSYLEFHSMSDCKLYGPEGELVGEITPSAEAPVLTEGNNVVEFTCETPAGVSARANVTVISEGDPLE